MRETEVQRGVRMRSLIWVILLALIAGCTCERVVERILPSPSPPRIDPLPELTNIPTLSVTGTKEKGTSVLLRGEEIVPLSDSETFQVLINLTEGKNTLQFSSRNGQGVESAVVVFIVVLDTIPPAQPTIGPFTSPTADPLPLLIGGKEAWASLYLNESLIISHGPSTQWEFRPSLTEGANALTFSSTDLAGNNSVATKVNIVLDTIPPASPVVEPAASPVSTPTVIVSGTKESETSLLLNGVEVVPFGADISWSSLVSLSEGNNIFSFQAKDLAGNMSSPTIVAVVLDTIPPSAPLVLSFTTPTNIPTQNISGVKEPQSSLWLNGIERVPISDGMLWSLSVGLVEGTNLLTFTSTDSVGNTSLPTSITIVLEIPPLAPSGLSFTVGDEVVNLDWADNTEPDLAGYTVYIGASSGGPYTKWNALPITTSSAIITELSNGTAYYFVVTAQDLFGNESGYSSEVSATPRVPPSITSISPDRGPRASYVTIAGSGFGPSQGSSTVIFNGATAGTALTWSDTSITIRVPQVASSGEVRVVVGNAPSDPMNFLVMPPTGLNFVEGAWDVYPSDAEFTFDPSTGYPSFCYIGRWMTTTTRNFYYLFWDGDSWDAQYISGATTYCSIAIDPTTGYPRIASSDDLNGVRYYTWDGFTWNRQVVEWEGTRDVSLKLNPLTGYPAIAYALGPEWASVLKYASWTGSNWSVETVDTEGGNAGHGPSLALDPVTGYPHISYTNSGVGLKFASWNGTTWDFQYVDPIAYKGSIAIDPLSGNPVITAYGILWRYDGVSWTKETFDGEPVFRSFSSLALDTITGNPHITYMSIYFAYGAFAVVSALKYAYFDGIQWHVKTLDRFTNIGYASTIALDPVSRLPRIAYIDYTPEPLIRIGPNPIWDIRYGTLKYYAMPASGDLTVEDATPRFADDKDTPITVSGQNFGLSQGESKLLLNGGEATVLTWTASMITAMTTQAFTSPGGVQIVLDSQDGGGKSNNGLKEMWLPDEAEIPDNHNGYKAQFIKSMALDPVTEYPRILFEERYETYNPSPYYYTYTAIYKYAEWDGTSWSVQTIDSSKDSPMEITLDGWAYLEIDPGTLEPKITYTKEDETELSAWIVYAYRNGGVWITQPVIFRYGATGIMVFHSFALDPVTGEPRISWWDPNTSPDSLKYTYFSGGTWLTQTVASNSFMYNAIAINPFTGYPGIAYKSIEGGSAYIRYARWTGSSWTTEVVDNLIDGRPGIDIALDPGTGYPRISYYRSDEADSPPGSRGLKYAFWDGAQWQTQYIEYLPGTNGTLPIEGITSLAIDPVTCYPWIAYWSYCSEGSPDSMKYAKWNGINWEIKCIGMSGSDLRDTLRITSDEKARLAFIWSPYYIIGLWKEP